MRSNLNHFLKKYKNKKNIYYEPNFHGYWSNLSISENKKLINRIKRTSTKITIKSLFPKLYPAKIENPLLEELLYPFVESLTEVNKVVS
jgi:hypothetical protein